MSRVSVKRIIEYVGEKAKVDSVIDMSIQGSRFVSSELTINAYTLNEEENTMAFGDARIRMEGAHLHPDECAGPNIKKAWYISQLIGYHKDTKDLYAFEGCVYDKWASEALKQVNDEVQRNA